VSTLVIYEVIFAPLYFIKSLMIYYGQLVFISQSQGGAVKNFDYPKYFQFFLKFFFFFSSNVIDDGLLGEEKFRELQGPLVKASVEDAITEKTIDMLLFSHTT